MAKKCIIFNLAIIANAPRDTFPHPNRRLAGAYYVVSYVLGSEKGDTTI